MHGYLWQLPRCLVRLILNLLESVAVSLLEVFIPGLSAIKAMPKRTPWNEGSEDRNIPSLMLFLLPTKIHGLCHWRLVTRALGTHRLRVAPGSCHQCSVMMTGGNFFLLTLYLDDSCRVYLRGRVDVGSG